MCNWRLEIKKHFDVSKNCFFPKPKINSTILSFKPRKNTHYKIKDPKAYKLINLKGEFAIKNINQIKNFLINHDELKEHISKIIVFPNNRWDVIAHNILFKLPNQDTNEAVNQINKFYNSKNLEMVDLRFFKKKIFLKMNTKKIALKNKK